MQAAEDTSDEGAYKPFAAMLQFALEALLLPCGGSSNAPQSMSFVTKMLRTLKRVSDASHEPKTSNMCDPTTASGVAEYLAPQSP